MERYNLWRKSNGIKKGELVQVFDAGDMLIIRANNNKKTNKIIK